MERLPGMLGGLGSIPGTRGKKIILTVPSFHGEKRGATEGKYLPRLTQMRGSEPAGQTQVPAFLLELLTQGHPAIRMLARDQEAGSGKNLKTAQPKPGMATAMPSPELPR